MVPTAYLFKSLESALRARVETAFDALLTPAVCVLAIAGVAALALGARQIIVARRQSTSRSITSAWSIVALVLVVAGHGSRVSTNAQTKAGAPPVVTITATPPFDTRVQSNR